MCLMESVSHQRAIRISPSSKEESSSNPLSTFDAGYPVPNAPKTTCSFLDQPTGGRNAPPLKLLIRPSGFVLATGNAGPLVTERHQLRCTDCLQRPNSLNPCRPSLLPSCTQINWPQRSNSLPCVSLEAHPMIVINCNGRKRHSIKITPMKKN